MKLHTALPAQAVGDHDSFSFALLQSLTEEIIARYEASDRFSEYQKQAS